jgi:hypothetical protein
LADEVELILGNGSLRKRIASMWLLGKTGMVRLGRSYRLKDSARRYCEHLRQILAGNRAAPTSPTDAREAAL